MRVLGLPIIVHKKVPLDTVLLAVACLRCQGAGIAAVASRITAYGASINLFGACPDCAGGGINVVAFSPVHLVPVP